jgi:hypothetical protein
MFFLGIMSLEGRPHEAIGALREKYIPTMQLNYMVWPACHFVNFCFVPPSLRILYINAITVVWGAVLSHVVMSEEVHHAHHDIKEGLPTYAEDSMRGAVSVSHGKRK